MFTRLYSCHILSTQNKMNRYRIVTEQYSDIILLIHVDAVTE